MRKRLHYGHAGQCRREEEREDSFESSRSVFLGHRCVIIGSAEALPILRVRYFWRERERERERYREREGGGIFKLSVCLSVCLSVTVCWSDNSATFPMLFKGALSRYSVIFCAILLWGKIMLAVHLSKRSTLNKCPAHACRLS